MLFLGQIALKEHDEKQFYLARQHIVDLRNLYAVITDLIQKNISKASEQISTQLSCIVLMILITDSGTKGLQ
jgi:hypothetical protein